MNLERAFDTILFLINKIHISVSPGRLNRAFLCSDSYFQQVCVDKCQIAVKLTAANRSVFIATSKV